jgi:hypothetical protein
MPIYEGTPAIPFEFIFTTRCLENSHGDIRPTV